MIKHIVLLLFITSNFAFAQQWVTYKITYGIEIDFPKDPTVIDTTSAFKIAFLDSASARFQVSEEPFSNYRYQNRINNKEDLISFYNHLGRLIIAANPGATLQSSTSVYKDDLLLQWMTYHIAGTPTNMCMARFFLTDSKVYMIQTCSADTTMVDSQLRFLVSLNVTGGHPFISQLEPKTADERAEELEKYRQKGVAYGYVLRYLSVVTLLGWLSLFLILIIKTKTAEPSRTLKSAFAVFRWASVGAFAVGSLALLIGLATQPASINASINIKTSATLVGLVLLTVVIAFVRTPSFRKPIV